MLGEVDLGAIDAKGEADFGDGFFFEDVEVVDGIVGGVDLAFDASEGFVEVELLPFGVPNRFERSGGILAELGGIIVRRREVFGMTCAFAELVSDFPAGDLQQPSFEGISGRIVLELGNFLGNGEEDVLEGFSGFLLVESRLATNPENESTISVVKFGPTRVGGVFDGVQEAGASGQWVVVFHGLGFDKIRCWHMDQPGIKGQIFRDMGHLPEREAGNSRPIQGATVSQPGNPQCFASQP